MNRIRLSAALTDRTWTAPLLRGEVHVEGVELAISEVHASEVFWRQARFQDFDVSEMSLSTYMIMLDRARRDGRERDWVALPVFASRRQFFHTGVRVRTDRDIHEPADLKGKRVAVPEYQQTAAVWTRGVLSDDFGVDPTEIEWFMERVPDKSHGGATAFVAPPGVTINPIPGDASIASMLLDGSIDATLRYINAKNLVDRSRVDLADHRDVVAPLFDPSTEPRRYFAQHGRYPVNHCVVIRRAAVDDHPWLPLNVYAAFLRARELTLESFRSHLEPYETVGLLDGGSREALGRDLSPYGLVANHDVLRTLCRYEFEQGLIGEPLEPEDIFDVRTHAL